MGRWRSLRAIAECNGPLAQPAGDCCIDRVGAVIKAKGYKPVRVMFYYPQREQAVKIQETLETLYKGIGGEYYCGDGAWSYIEKMTDIDLLGILEKIAQSRE